jgi:hypothetical protein
MTTREMLQQLREAPAMYLSRPSARTLHAFLAGFGLARKDSEPESLVFFNDFNNWLRKRYDIKSSQHWTKIIEFYSLTEGDEMDLFWKLFDEFEAKRGKRKSARLTSARSSAAAR